jgi:hypothetical protein
MAIRLITAALLWSVANGCARKAERTKLIALGMRTEGTNKKGRRSKAFVPSCSYLGHVRQGGGGNGWAPLDRSAFPLVLKQQDSQIFVRKERSARHIKHCQWKLCLRAGGPEAPQAGTARQAGHTGTTKSTQVDESCSNAMADAGEKKRLLSLPPAWNRAGAWLRCWRARRLRSAREIYRR